MKLVARLLCALTVMAGVASSAMAADLMSDVKSRGYIRVGMFVAPPESWVDTETGEWKGIDADFTKAIAKDLGVDIDVIPLTHAALAPALNSGRVDVIVGLYHTDERAKVIAYNKTPFWFGVDALVTQKDRPDIKGFADLKGKTVGVVRGSAQELEATKLQEKFGVTDIKKYDTGDTMLMDVKAGRVDAGMVGLYVRLCGQAEPQLRPAAGRLHAAGISRLPPSLPGVYYTFPKEGSESLIKFFDAKLEKMVTAGETKRVLESYGLTSTAYQTGQYKK